MILKKIFETSFFVTNSIIFIWGTICFNDYRNYIETSLSVPENVYSNRSFFIISLNIAASLGSIMTYFSNIGRKGREIFYGVNCIVSIYLGSISMINYNNCDSECISFIRRHNFSDANLLLEYLSLIQLLIVLEYLAYGICLLCEARIDSVLSVNPVFGIRNENDFAIKNEDELFPSGSELINDKVITTNNNGRRVAHI